MNGRLPLLCALAALLAACGTGDAGNDQAADVRKAAVQTAELVGLYESEAGDARNQLCILDRATGDSRFGLVVWGNGRQSCSGEGLAVRTGAVLRLAMDGDETCAIDARIENGTVTLPETLPEGCAYYCGPQASMAGVSFEKTGGTAEDAMRAADLVGDPLCG